MRNEELQQVLEQAQTNGDKFINIPTDTLERLMEAMETAESAEEEITELQKEIADLTWQIENGSDEDFQ